MEYTYDDLHAMTVAELREVAKDVDHEAVQGYTQMNKDHLLPALCEALGIESHAHHEVLGIDKKKVKARIRELKQERAAALAARDHARLKRTRRRIRRLKRRIRKATTT